jgi:hypothetical protein
MPLKHLAKITSAWRGLTAGAMLAAAALGLGGCVSSTAPILSEANALIGERGQLHLFGAAQSGSREHRVRTFQWSGSRYVISGRNREFTDFTVHAYEGRDLIVQTRSVRTPNVVEYAIARKLSEGVYLVFPISEEDADEPTRERFCTRTEGAACRISTPEQLFVLARASAAKEEEQGGIAVIVPPKRR